jgi:hypothetical protein
MEETKNAYKFLEGKSEEKRREEKRRFGTPGAQVP